MSTNTIAALKAVFITQEIYPENLSDRQVAALQAIQDFLDWWDAAQPPASGFLSADLSRQAQSLINEAAESGLHAYAHHAGKTTFFSLKKKPEKTWAITLEAVDIRCDSANQRT